MKNSHAIVLFISLVGILIIAGCSKDDSSPSSNNLPPPETLTGKIVFVSSEDGDDEIYTINANGTGQTKLTDNSYSDKQPSWSPDGRKIAFTSNSEVYVMDSLGGNQVQITHDPVGASYEEDYPSWSPAGTILAYENYQDASSEDNGTSIDNANIYTAASNGSGGYIKLTSHLFYDGVPSYSPNGSLIAFVHAEVDTLPGPIYVSTGYNIYIMNSNGTNWQKLTSGANDLHPKFSPDGTKIVYDSDEGIKTVDLLGNSSPILNYGGNPCFSPDGTKIIFDASFKIYVMNANGSNVKEIPTIGHAKQPAWTE